jgi:LAO/AO transport system kinase
VAIIAVDPTSPFSGGANLGDRIRMRDLAGDPGVMIRSMASRGSLGGLAWATADAVRVMDAGGYDLVFIETVGAGQAEVDIARTAHTTVVVEVPGLGDDIQAIKAGILEIADIFVVNKADYEGADHAVKVLKMMLDLNSSSPQTVLHHGQLMEVAATTAGSDGANEPPWRPPIVKAVAIRSEGIDAIADAIRAHRAHLEQTGSLARRERERAAAELETIVKQEALRRVLASTGSAELGEMIERIAARELDPYAAGRLLLDRSRDQSRAEGG